MDESNGDYPITGSDLVSDVDSKSGISLNTIGQLVALSVILFPVVGFLGTAFSVSLNSRLAAYGAVSLALDHSIPWLAYRGAVAFLWLAIFVLGLWAGELSGQKSTDHLRSRFPEMHERRRVLLITSVVVLALVVVYLLFINFYMGLYEIVAAPLLVWTFNKLTREKPTSFRQLWLPTVVLALTSTLSVSVLPIVAPAGRVTFSPNSDVANGEYSVVAQDGSQVFLLPCTPNAPLVSVNSADLLSAVYTIHKRASTFVGLAEILERGKWPTIGESSACPRR